MLSKYWAHACTPSTWEAEQEDYKFQTTLSQIVKPCLKNPPQNQQQKIHITRGRIEWIHNGGHELIQSTLYACMECMQIQN
jgi:hypothetical protein